MMKQMKCALFPDSCSEEPEDNSVSEYELARLKRIKENKGMWQELMKDLIVSFWVQTSQHALFMVFFFY